MQLSDAYEKCMDNIICTFGVQNDRKPEHKKLKVLKLYNYY
jgi:hypothetical protein